MTTYRDRPTASKSELNQFDTTDGLNCSVNHQINLNISKSVQKLKHVITFDMRRFDEATTILLGVLLLGSSLTSTFLGLIPISISILTVTISMLYTMEYFSIVYVSTTQRTKTITQETLAFATKLWFILFIILIGSIADIFLYWSDRLDELIFLSTVRSEALNNIEYRSILGRIAGLFLLPFATLSVVLYAIKKNIVFIITGLAICSLFSVAMGGRGAILFMMLILLPIFAFGSIIKMMGLVAVGIITLSSIHYWREGGSLTEGVLSLIEYYREGWLGFSTILNGNIDLMTFRVLGNWTRLDEYTFIVNDRVGNIYAGIGNGLYLFGYYGYTVFAIASGGLFLFLIRTSRNSFFWALYFRLLMFLYFAFQPFHDPIIFYSSFIVALIIGLLILIKDKLKI